MNSLTWKWIVQTEIKWTDQKPKVDGPPWIIDDGPKSDDFFSKVRYNPFGPYTFGKGRVLWTSPWLSTIKKYNRKRIETHDFWPFFVVFDPLWPGHIMTLRDLLWLDLKLNNFEWTCLNLSELEKEKKMKKKNEKLSRRSSNRLRMSLNVPGIWIT